jgi:RNA polymerase sigma-70 factor (ECF subfamily)
LAAAPGRSFGVGSLSHDNPPDATRKSLEAWVLSTLPRALGYASSLLRDPALAEDVVHDCYLRLLQRADVYDLLRDGTKLLYKAITNACIDRNHRERLLLSLNGSATERGESFSVIDAEQPGPLQIVIQNELEDAVEEGMAQLPVAQRAALELKSLGSSTEEIAEALGTSPSNAGVLVHRARKALAQGLASFMGSNRDERRRETTR